MSERSRPSLRRVLFVAIAGVAVGAVVVAAVLTLGFARLGAERTALSRLRADAERLAGVAEDLPCRPGAFGPRQLQAAGARFIPDRAGPRGPLPQDEAGRATLQGREVLYATAETVLCGERGRLVVFRPVDALPALPEGIGGRFVLAGLAAVGLSAVVAFLLARRITRPLGRLAAGARELPHGGEPPPAAPGDPVEVEDLRAAFADMARDLGDARARERSFLLSVSHELRTPLTAVRGYGEALADGTARSGRQAGEVIVRESERLERLVGDLLDLARLEAGEFSVELEEADLAAIAASVVDAFRPAAAQAGVGLEHRGDGPSWVRTDPDRAQQMLANLVENAMRVTPAGGRVTVAVDGEEASVEDSGPGLEPEDHARAFDRFYLWRKYQGERPVGSGLGLAVVGELAARLDVRVELASRPGEGTRFSLRFPGSADTLGA